MLHVGKIESYSSYRLVRMKTYRAVDIPFSDEAVVLRFGLPWKRVKREKLFSWLRNHEIGELYGCDLTAVSLILRHY